MGNFFTEFLDQIGLTFLPENHVPPAYGYTAPKVELKPVQKTEEKPKKNRLKIHSEFVEKELTAEDGNAEAVFANDKHVDNRLTEADRIALAEAGLSLEVAAIVKKEKIKPPGEVALSNKQIADKYHTPGARDGFSKRTIDSIAAIVAPSPRGRG